MITDFKKALQLPQFGLSDEDLSILNERTLVVRKWNWAYSSAHEFQRHVVNLLQDYSQMRVLICCNHPRVLTHGRGLQRPKKGETLDLVAFRPENFPSLPYPLHQIERGGGLTFHHPGQFIFYPILKLNPHVLSLSKMIDDIFKASIAVLNEWGVKDLDHTRKMLGLWKGDRKIASMGIAIERLTTFHGMALNVHRDSEMEKALTILNPCGLSSATYTSVDEILGPGEKSLENFTKIFLKRISDVW